MLWWFWSLRMIRVNNRGTIFRDLMLNSLGKPDEVFMVGVHIRQLDVDQQQHLRPQEKSWTKQLIKAGLCEDMTWLTCCLVRLSRSRMCCVTIRSISSLSMGYWASCDTNTRVCDAKHKYDSRTWDTHQSLQQDPTTVANNNERDCKKKTCCKVYNKEHTNLTLYMHVNRNQTGLNASTCMSHDSKFQCITVFK